jgi:hypothetical protein
LNISPAKIGNEKLNFTEHFVLNMMQGGRNGYVEHPMPSAETKTTRVDFSPMYVNSKKNF